MEVYTRATRPEPGIVGRVILEVDNAARPSACTVLYDTGNAWVPSAPEPPAPLGQARMLREDLTWVAVVDTPRNLLVNGGFEVWQGSRGEYTPAVQNYFIGADQWLFRHPYAAFDINNWYVSRQAGLTPGSQYSLLFSAVGGLTHNDQVSLYQNLETRDSLKAAGHYVTLSHSVRLGPAFTGFDQFLPDSSHYSVIWCGTSTDGQIQSGSFSTISDSYVDHLAATDQVRRFHNTMWVPEATTQIAIGFFWILAPATPADAGWSDSICFDDIQLEINDVPTAFERRNFGEELHQCKRFFQKSFAYETAPVQNFGGVGASVHIVMHPGAQLTACSPEVRLTPVMRTAPTITIYNAKAANAFMRNEHTITDSTTAAGFNITDQSFLPWATGAATWAKGDHVSFHWTADARL